mmetsp:Transcript_42762/g.99069  ORF Transcript_42762/g.99069 Transcript_42762/m.99069 type:complete len:82 (-) Transcript_42762:283-528(-)
MPKLKGERETVYAAIQTQTDKLKDLLSKMPKTIREEATYLCDTVKPQMQAVREQVDKAEGLMDKELYPFPTYQELVYSHHS